MTSELKLGAIGQIARRVSDVDAAVTWYRDVLGLPLLYRFGDLAFFDCNGTRLFISDEDDGPSAANSILYFRVDDIAAAHAALVEKGVKFIAEPHMIFKHPDGVEEWMAFFKDQDDATLALMSQVQAGE